MGGQPHQPEDHEDHRAADQRPDNVDPAVHLGRLNHRRQRHAGAQHPRQLAAIEHPQGAVLEVGGHRGDLEEIAARIAYWAEIVAPIVNEPVGATNISLTRDYNNESNMGDIVTDSMLWSDSLVEAVSINVWVPQE